MWRARHADSLPPDRLSMRSPATVIDPLVGVSRPLIKVSSGALPEPAGPISARKSPSGMSRLTPCRTSIRWPPREKILWRSRTATREFDIQSLLLHLHLVAVLEGLRPLDDDALAGTDARQHFDLIAVLEADANRAALDAVLVEHEHHGLAVDAPDRDLRHDHRRRRRRLACGRRVAEERHLHAHVGQDLRIERLEPDAHLHGRLLAIGRRNR